MSSTEFPILLLGPESCGKTLLLKSLQYYSQEGGRVWNFGSIPKHGRATVGVDLINFTLPIFLGDTTSKKQKQSFSKKNQNSISVVVRELGGQMSPLWSTYFNFEQCRALIFCIDSLNPFQASRAAVELARILKNPKLRNNVEGVLIVFTKSADLLDEKELSIDDGKSKSESSSSSRLSIIELRSLMLLDDILDEAKPFFKSIDVIATCCAVTGAGLKEIFAWMERKARC